MLADPRLKCDVHDLKIKERVCKLIIVLNA
jgi:hypothetical protein